MVAAPDGEQWKVAMAEKYARPLHFVVAVLIFLVALLDNRCCARIDVI